MVDLTKGLPWFEKSYEKTLYQADLQTKSTGLI